MSGLLICTNGLICIKLIFKLFLREFNLKQFTPFFRLIKRNICLVLKIIIRKDIQYH